jgi:hypothetical protein
VTASATGYWADTEYVGIPSDGTTNSYVHLTLRARALNEYAIDGVVVNPTTDPNTPVSGAEIRIEYSDNRPALTLTTDSDGKYHTTYTYPTDIPTQLTVTKQDFFTHTEPLWPGTGQDLFNTISLWPKAAQFKVIFLVWEPNYSPIAGAQVTISPYSGGSPLQVLTTHPDGTTDQIVLHGQDLPLTIQASATGYQPASPDTFGVIYLARALSIFSTMSIRVFIITLNLSGSSFVL